MAFLTNTGSWLVLTFIDLEVKKTGKWSEISTFNIPVSILLSKEFVRIWSIIVALGFANMTSLSKHLYVVVFPLQCLVTRPSSISISSLVPELCQFLFIRHWPEIQKLFPTELVHYLGYGEFEMPNSAEAFLIENILNPAKCQIYSFPVSELLRENQQGWWDG